MTALVLGRIESPRYAIVGKRSEQAVSHVGLLESAATLQEGQSVAVFEMANHSSRLRLPGTMDAHFVGWIDNLTEEERYCIDDWIDELRTIKSNVWYLAFPAAEFTPDRVNGRIIGRRFSCAGFVRTCFEEALKIKLVAPEDELPEVCMCVLRQVWGDIVVSAGRRYLRGQEPWRVLLPSYLFHALSKRREEMPHQPTHADPCFPASMPSVHT